MNFLKNVTKDVVLDQTTYGPIQSAYWGAQDRTFLGPYSPGATLGVETHINSTHKESLKGHPAELMWSYCPVLCLFSPATDPFEAPKHRVPIGHQQGTPPQAGAQKVHKLTHISTDKLHERTTFDQVMGRGAQ